MSSSVTIVEKSLSKLFFLQTGMGDVVVPPVVKVIPAGLCLHFHVGRPVPMGASEGTCPLHVHPLPMVFPEVNSHGRAL